MKQEVGSGLINLKLMQLTRRTDWQMEITAILARAATITRSKTLCPSGYSECAAGECGQSATKPNLNDGMCCPYEIKTVLIISFYEIKWYGRLRLGLKHLR